MRRGRGRGGGRGLRRRRGGRPGVGQIELPHDADGAELVAGVDAQDARLAGAALERVRGSALGAPVGAHPDAEGELEGARRRGRGADHDHACRRRGRGPRRHTGRRPCTVRHLISLSWASWVAPKLTVITESAVRPDRGAAAIVRQQWSCRVVVVMVVTGLVLLGTWADAAGDEPTTRTAGHEGGDGGRAHPFTRMEVFMGLLSESR